MASTTIGPMQDKGAEVVPFEYAVDCFRNRFAAFLTSLALTAFFANRGSLFWCDLFHPRDTALFLLMLPCLRKYSFTSFGISGNFLLCHLNICSRSNECSAAFL